MPGHKREYDGQFAQIEVGFILNDPRCTGMTSPEFRYYIFVWCLAVKERMEVLPTWWDATSLQRHCSLDTRTAQKCRSSLLQKCILDETNDGRLIVCGVKSKHPNLKWKDDRLDAPNVPLKHPQTEDRNRNKNISKKQKGLDSESVRLLWNSICPPFSKLRKMDGARQQLVAIGSNDIEDYESFFNRVQASDFLRKNGGPGGWADFQWIINHRLLILEGKYDNRKTKPKEPEHGPTGPTTI